MATVVAPDLRKGRTHERAEFTEVEALPRDPKLGGAYWISGGSRKSTYTHGFLRFPAKFHVPVVEWALDRYPNANLILDPFTGSGTVQVQAMLAGRDSIGIDVDPLAVLVARVKTTPLPKEQLLQARESLYHSISGIRPCLRPEEQVPGGDITEQEFHDETLGLWIPPIPNIIHWFRRYVIVDMAHLLNAIEQGQFSESVRDFLRCCFAAIIRRVSNADPHPVSGLEVTKIQKELNGQRLISVFRSFFDRVDRNIAGMDETEKHLASQSLTPSTNVIRGDITVLDGGLPAELGSPTLVITSPPYCRAVEYSRRHKLEMYWLKHVSHPQEHVDLAHQYIGRTRVRRVDLLRDTEFGSNRLNVVLAEVRNRDPDACRSLVGYFQSMQTAFDSIAASVSVGVPFICVIGDSRCAGVDIPTADMLVDLAYGTFSLESRFDYAIRNHYMQYGLRNGNGIKREHVLIFGRK